MNTYERDEQTMLTSMKPLLLAAKEKQTAVGAFSVATLAMAQGAVRAAETLGVPIILQITECRLPFAPLALFGPSLIALAQLASVPVAVHLDHGVTLECIKNALDIGFTSVMIDGSALSPNDNIALTKRVIALAAPYQAAVEGEVGRIGRTEDGKAAPAQTADEGECLRFANETGVDALAVGIGNAHGVYQSAPVLNFALVERLSKSLPCPMVLHGGTGLTVSDYRRLIARGMAKINIATALNQTVCEARSFAGEDSLFENLLLEKYSVAEQVGQYLQIFMNGGE